MFSHTGVGLPAILDLNVNKVSSFFTLSAIIRSFFDKRNSKKLISKSIWFLTAESTEKTFTDFARHGPV